MRRRKRIFPAPLWLDPPASFPFQFLKRDLFPPFPPPPHFSREFNDSRLANERLFFRRKRTFLPSFPLVAQVLFPPPRFFYAGRTSVSPFLSPLLPLKVLSLSFHERKVSIRPEKEVPPLPCMCFSLFFPFVERDILSFPSGSIVRAIVHSWTCRRFSLLTPLQQLSSPSSLPPPLTEELQSPFVFFRRYNRRLKADPPSKRHEIPPFPLLHPVKKRPCSSFLPFP